MKTLYLGLRVLLALLNPFRKVKSDNVASDHESGETTNFGNLFKNKQN